MTNEFRVSSTPLSPSRRGSSPAPLLRMASPMAPVAGVASSPPASTARDSCWKFNPDKLNEWCTAAAGHRGRHAYRPIPRANTKPKEVAVPEMDRDLEAPAEPMDEEGESYPPPTKGPWQPDESDFINLKGKMYLPARRRVQWLREEHPDWTIDTDTEVFERGKRSGPGRVEDGFAVVRANVFDADGRLISTGVKSEYSENFADFLEKAETGAIARAVAIAGYGTESALDLDEGVDRERIADAPVERKARMGPSAVPGVGRGGKTDGSSVAQIRRVAELSRGLSLGPVGLAGIIENVLDQDVPEMPTDEAGQSRIISTFLSQRGSDEVGKLIAALEAAVAVAK